MTAKKVKIAVSYFLLALFALLSSFSSAAEPSGIVVETQIPSKYLQVESGEAIVMQSDIILRQNETNALMTDVLLEYVIKDSSGTTTAKVSETKGGIFRFTTVKELHLPSEANPGMYAVEVIVRYKDLAATDSAMFEVIRPQAGISFWQNYLGFGTTLLLVPLLLLWFWRLHHLARKLEQNRIPSDLTDDDKAQDKVVQDKIHANTIHFTYPNYASLEYEKAGLVPLVGAETSLLLKKATEHIHALNYPQAVAHVHVLQSYLESPHASKNKSRHVEKHVEKLQKKVHLLLKLQQLQACLDNNDFLNLKYPLNEAAALYNQLQPGNHEEKKFLEKVKTRHDHFAKAMLRSN